MINIILLGTSCMVPTKDRNVTSFYLEYKGEGILFDCGEGTQRQMNIAGINRNNIRKIFISHWHGDHVGGLIGLLQTISNSRDRGGLEIFGPKGTKKRIKSLLESVYFGNISELGLEVHEFDCPELVEICNSEGYIVQAANLEHKIPTLGFRFVEKDRRRVSVKKVRELGIPDGPMLGSLQKGKSITFKGKKYDADDLTYVVKGKIISFVMDTSYVENTLSIADDADLMISEATYMEKDQVKGEEHSHLTVSQAALIANNANAKKLVLTHFSQRYNDMAPLEEEAKSIFENSFIGYDFMKLKV